MSNGPQAFTADSGALSHPLVQTDLSVGRAAAKPRVGSAAHGFWRDPGKIGVLSNPRSHRNRLTGVKAPPADAALTVEQPRSPAELANVLARFADEGIDLLIIDGGDGTVRDVITAAAGLFTGWMPRLAVVPSGKTNALALDLGIPRDWTVEDAIAAARANRFAERAPIEIRRRDGEETPPVRGFLFGAGAFVRATSLAQRTHRAGAFNGLAVGLSLSLALAQTFFGSAGNSWRVGERMRIRSDDGREADRHFYILVGSTLENLPLGLKPFGEPRPGLKVLAVDAPPKRMAFHVPALLAGSERAGLRKAGYHRGDPKRFDVSLASGFILDGEFYPGGDLTVAAGEPLLFAVP